MIRSLYNGASALNVLTRQHEQISNNLANINTAGFRRADFAAAQRNANIRSRNNFGSGPEIGQRVIDFTQGKLVQSGRNLDVAIAGDGFFVLQGPNGQELYTKSGQFYRDGDTGQLRSDQNLPVLGGGSPIQIDPGTVSSDIQITSEGKIFAGEQQLGQLDIVAFEDNQTLFPVNQSVFRQTRESQIREADVQVSQGFREVSNVNVTSELIALIIGGRQYDAVQKATRAISESMEQSIRA